MFSTLSDPYLLFAVIIGVVALALASLLVVSIVALRISLNRRELSEQRFVETWRPVLMEALADPATSTLPVLRARDCLSFLKLWNYLQESLRGEATDSLNQVARRLGCDTLARRLLQVGSRTEKLLAIMTLGHLRDREAWLDLLRLVRSKDTVTSLLAARALIQIDPKTGAEFLLPWILVRQDWEIARVARMLADARAAFARLLARSVARTRANELLRALQLVEALRLQLPVTVINPLLDPRQLPMVLAAALRLARSPELLDSVRGHLAHADWRVRAGAVQALGRFGTPADVALLTDRLGDAEWWVRYHAAHALAGSADVGHGGLARLQASATDPAVLQILVQVMAERGTPSPAI